MIKISIIHLISDCYFFVWLHFMSTKIVFLNLLFFFFCGRISLLNIVPDLCSFLKHICRFNFWVFYIVARAQMSFHIHPNPLQSLFIIHIFNFIKHKYIHFNNMIHELFSATSFLCFLLLCSIWSFDTSFAITSFGVLD